MQTENSMLVEIFHVEMTKAPLPVTSIRVIAVQYHSWDSKMEAAMRNEAALFDIEMSNMSALMKQRIQDGTHRTAIFELAP